jgi:hypothetical protein
MRQIFNSFNSLNFKISLLFAISVGLSIVVNILTSPITRKMLSGRYVTDLFVEAISLFVILSILLNI